MTAWRIIHMILFLFYSAQVCNKYPYPSLSSREGVSPLCHGCQSLRSSGSCVSDDLPRPVVGRGHHRCAFEPRHRTQLWVSGAAQTAGAEPQSAEETGHRGGPHWRIMTTNTWPVTFVRHPFYLNPRFLSKQWNLMDWKVMFVFSVTSKAQLMTSAPTTISMQLLNALSFMSPEITLCSDKCPTPVLTYYRHSHNDNNCHMPLLWHFYFSYLTIQCDSPPYRRRESDHCHIRGLRSH